MMTHETPPTRGRTVVYIAGACKGYHTGPGGWAWVVLGERPDSSSAPIEQVASGGVPDTTSDRMELTALREAITSLDGKLVIMTNSRYVTDCLEQMSRVGYRNSNWLKKNKKFAQHQDFWEPIIKAYLNGKIMFDWAQDGSKDSGISEATTRAEQAASEVAASSRTVVYTAGASKGHPGNPGGWAWVVLGERPDSSGMPIEQVASGGVPDTTKERMELMAVRRAIASLAGELLLKTYGTYVSSFLRQMTQGGEEISIGFERSEEFIKHQDLWKPIIKAYRKGRVVFDLEKSDSSSLGNKAATAQASQAANAITASSRTVVYTDGSCRVFPDSSSETGFGGWGWVVLGGRFASGGVLDTTSDCMELVAVLEAINSLDGELLIISDYTHFSDRFEEERPFQWKQNGWLNSNLEPVANQKLWQLIMDAYHDGKVVFDQVKGHSGDPGNEAADTLARRESKKIAKNR